MGGGNNTLQYGDIAAILRLNMATISRFFSAPRDSFFLFGPRGTGKTTTAQSTHIDNHEWNDRTLADCR